MDNINFEERNAVGFKVEAPNPDDDKLDICCDCLRSFDVVKGFINPKTEEGFWIDCCRCGKKI